MSLVSSELGTQIQLQLPSCLEYEQHHQVHAIPFPVQPCRLPDPCNTIYRSPCLKLRLLLLLLQLRMSQDIPGEGHFISGLASFMTRTCYANSSGGVPLRPGLQPASTSSWAIVCLFLPLNSMQAGCTPGQRRGCAVKPAMVTSVLEACCHDAASQAREIQCRRLTSKQVQSGDLQRPAHEQDPASAAKFAPAPFHNANVSSKV